MLCGAHATIAVEIVSYFWEFYGGNRSTFVVVVVVVVVVVEPEQTDCLYQSAITGKACVQITQFVLSQSADSYCLRSFQFQQIVADQNE